VKENVSITDANALMLPAESGIHNYHITHSSRGGKHGSSLN